MLGRYLIAYRKDGKVEFLKNHLGLPRLFSPSSKPTRLLSNTGMYFIESPCRMILVERDCLASLPDTIYISDKLQNTLIKAEFA